MTHDQQRWEARLWAAGHRVTRQRAVILDAVCSGGGHTTLPDVYARVRAIDRSIDRSTIYRALRLFVDLGIVLQADTGGDELLYEIPHHAPHHHLVCRVCDQQWEIDDAAFRSMQRDIEQRHGFHVATDHLVLFGTCATCVASLRDAEARDTGSVIGTSLAFDTPIAPITPFPSSTPPE